MAVGKRKTRQDEFWVAMNQIARTPEDRPVSAVCRPGGWFWRDLRLCAAVEAYAQPLNVRRYGQVPPVRQAKRWWHSSTVGARGRLAHA